MSEELERGRALGPCICPQAPKGLHPGAARTSLCWELGPRYLGPRTNGGRGHGDCSCHQRCSELKQVASTLENLLGHWGPRKPKASLSPGSQGLSHALDTT